MEVGGGGGDWRGEERLMEDWRPIGGGEEGVEENCG